MKNVKYFIVGTLLICTISFSCKKDSAQEPTTIEYLVTPMNSDIMEIDYRDTSGSVQQVMNPSLPNAIFKGNDFIKLPASKNLKGFTALLRIFFVPGTEDFRLQILVNGQDKKDSTILANSSAGHIQYQLP